MAQEVQDGPRELPGRPRMAPRRLYVGPSWLKLMPRWPLLGQKWSPQKTSKNQWFSLVFRSPGRPRMVQDGAKMAPGWPQDGPGWSKMGQDDPKVCPGAPLGGSGEVMGGHGGARRAQGNRPGSQKVASHHWHARSKGCRNRRFVHPGLPLGAALRS